MPDPNLPLLEYAVSRLLPVLDEIVFVGGATLGLLINDPGAAPVRATNDVDVSPRSPPMWTTACFRIVLRNLGFSEDHGPGAPTCRWVIGNLRLDVMALEANVLGFSNRWYGGALESAVSVALPSGVIIRVITAPYFLGTKLEAFRGRGNRDFQSSHDLEDFVSIIDGRDSIITEIKSASADLRNYLAAGAVTLLAEQSFIDALPGFLLPDEASQRRLHLVLQKLEDLASLA